jgi:hypothetical protein
VFVVSEADFDTLLGAGHSVHPVGSELQPARRIPNATLDEIHALTSARELRVRLSAELLAEGNWVLVPFD